MMVRFLSTRETKVSRHSIVETLVSLSRDYAFGLSRAEAVYEE